jgi:hypothetical protein
MFLIFILATITPWWWLRWLAETCKSIWNYFALVGNVNKNVYDMRKIMQYNYAIYRSNIIYDFILNKTLNVALIHNGIDAEKDAVEVRSLML